METNENEKMTYQSLWNIAKEYSRELHSNTDLPQETGKISNKQFTLQLKEVPKEKQTPRLVNGRI